MFIVHVHCSLFMFIVHCSHGATLIFDDLFFTKQVHQSEVSTDHLKWKYRIIILHTFVFLFNYQGSASISFTFLWLFWWFLRSFFDWKFFPHSTPISRSFSHLFISWTTVCLFKFLFDWNFFWQIIHTDSICCCMCFFNRYSFVFLLKHLLHTKLLHDFSPTCCLFTWSLKYYLLWVLYSQDSHCKIGMVLTTCFSR